MKVAINISWFIAQSLWGFFYTAWSVAREIWTAIQDVCGLTYDPAKWCIPPPKNWNMVAEPAKPAQRRNDDGIKYTRDGVAYRDVKPAEVQVFSEWDILTGATAEKAGRSPALSDADKDAIAALKLSIAKAAVAKRLWAEDRTAKQAALIMGASDSLVSKMFAAFEKAANPSPTER